MLEILRKIKYFLWEISKLKIIGFHVDFVLHFLMGSTIFYFLQKKYSIKKSFIFTLFFIVIKESADVFVKSRAEYIRPPGLDVLGDLAFGLLGIALILFLKKYKIPQQQYSLLEKIEVNLSFTIRRIKKHIFSSFLLVLVVGILLGAFLSTYAILLGTRKHLSETMHPFQVSPLNEKGCHPMTTNDCYELMQRFSPYINKVNFILVGYLPVQINYKNRNFKAELTRLEEPLYNPPQHIEYYGESVTTEELFYNPKITFLRMNNQNYNEWGHDVIGKNLNFLLPQLKKSIFVKVAGIYITESSFIQGHISPFSTPDFFNMTLHFIHGTPYKVILEMNRYLENQSYGYEVPLTVISRAKFIQLQIVQFNRLFLLWSATTILIGIITLSLIFYRMTNRRFNEISIRKVEGALVSDIFLQFFCDYFILFIIGSIVGTIFGVSLAYFSQKLANHEYIKAYLPSIVCLYGIMGTLFLGFISVLIPTNRATKVLPAEIMRYE